MIGEAAQAVAEVYGLGSPNGAPVAAARGELGRIWQLDTDRGRWAVKELLDPTTDAAATEAVAKRDVAFQVAALEAGLPLPRPIVRGDGEVLTSITGPDGGPVTFRVYAWVDLAKPDRAPDASLVAALLARLHRLDVPADGPMDPWFAEPLGQEGWGALAEEVRAAAPPWVGQFARLALAAERAEAIVNAARLGEAPIASLRRCHLDFNPENVLLDINDRAVILDWENSDSAPRDQELAMAMLDFAPEPAEAASFVREYHAAGGPANVVDRSSFGMALAVQSHLTDTYARRGITATTDEDRARAACRIDEMDRTLFTIESIDRVLEELGREELDREELDRR